MPRSEPIVGLPGIEPVEFHGRLQQVVTTAELVGDPTCPDCQSTGPHRRKDTITRRIRHTSMGIRAHWLVIRVPKWRCMRSSRHRDHRNRRIVIAETAAS